MKINLPVNEVETTLPVGEYMFSQTDLKGVIVDANPAFCKISGFSREEMVGHSHNIVRHPDMPPEAFEDMWISLKAGRPWRGIVKNRTKKGGFYWVVANVSPVRQNSEVIGYQSVRTRPTDEEIKSAKTAYERIKNGDKSIKISRGRVIRSRRTIMEALTNPVVQFSVTGLLFFLLAVGSFAEFFLKTGYLVDAMAAVSVAGVLWGMFSAAFFLPGLVRDMRKTQEAIDHILSTGDMTKSISVARRDQVGEIAFGLETMVLNMKSIIQGMEDNAKQVAQISDQVTKNVKEEAESTLVQNEATFSASSAVEQIEATISGVAERTTGTRKAAEKTRKESLECVETSEKTVKAIQSLSDSVKVAAAQVERLGEKSKDIDRITGVIHEIADQISLLSLNAAIEAARAGDAGRGFAVVADEVRKLSERANKATQEISATIGTIIGETEGAVSSMREGAEHVNQGVQGVQQVRSSLTEIANEMKDTEHMIAEIECATNEQRDAIGMMARNVGQISNMAIRTEDASKSTKEAVELLNRSILRMKAATQQFKTA